MDIMESIKQDMIDQGTASPEVIMDDKVKKMIDGDIIPKTTVVIEAGKDSDDYNKPDKATRFGPGNKSKGAVSKFSKKACTVKMRQELINKFADDDNELLEPIEFLAGVWSDKTEDKKLRVTAAAQGLPYIYSKQTTIDMTIDDKQSLNVEQMNNRILELLAKDAGTTVEDSEVILIEGNE